MSHITVVECVVNVSEGRDADLLAELSRAAGPTLLDLHCDGDHNRSVFSLVGAPSAVDEGVRGLARATVERVDLRVQRGVHPRIGVLDVVPFVSLARTPGSWNLEDGDLAVAQRARDRFARWAAEALELPCFLYGADRSLPDVRRRAWSDLQPDTGPRHRHPSAGGCAVGARGLLVAYNLWLDARALHGHSVGVARQIAAELRGPALRTLGLAVAGTAQVSCNLVAPSQLGPCEAFDAVASRAPVARAELVGLLPRSVLDATPRHRWAELGLASNLTIEARLEEAGLDGGRFPAAR